MVMQEYLLAKTDMSDRKISQIFCNYLLFSVVWHWAGIGEVSCMQATAFTASNEAGAEVSTAYVHALPKHRQNNIRSKLKVIGATRKNVLRSCHSLRKRMMELLLKCNTLSFRSYQPQVSIGCKTFVMRFVKTDEFF